MKQVMKKPESAEEKFGITVKLNKELDKLKGKSLFPRKTEEINKLVSKLNPE
jgi:hypothetical protein